MTLREELLKAADPWVVFEASDGMNSLKTKSDEEILAAIQAALPDGYYLGNNGIFRSQFAGYADYDEGARTYELYDPDTFLDPVEIGDET